MSRTSAKGDAWEQVPFPSLLTRRLQDAACADPCKKVKRFVESTRTSPNTPSSVVSSPIELAKERTGKFSGKQPGPSLWCRRNPSTRLLSIKVVTAPTEDLIKRDFFAEYHICDGPSSIGANWYHCVRKSDGKAATVKKVSTVDPDRVMKVRAEFLLMKRFDHPFISKALDYFDTGDAVMLVLERIEGRPLSQLVSASARGCLQEETTRRISGAILRVVEYMHENKTILSRWKPENVVVSEEASKVTVVRLSDARPFYFRDTDSAVTEDVVSAARCVDFMLTCDRSPTLPIGSTHLTRCFPLHRMTTGVFAHASPGPDTAN